MNRELLERPFPTEQIRQRKGRNGMLDYVEGHSVIQRLNEALEGAWSFEIVHHEIREEEVLVLGKLVAGGVTKMQFGASQVTRERESGALISLGDDLKAAGTDCLKIARRVSACAYTSTPRSQSAGQPHRLGLPLRLAHRRARR